MQTEQMTKCRRCEGMIVRDSIYTLDDQFHQLEVLRCLNCGETVDATILKAREGKINPGRRKGPRFSSRKAVKMPGQTGGVKALITS